MDSQSPDGSPVSSNENVNRPPHADNPAPRGDVETSVFEALRPLFRPKRKEPREEHEAQPEPHAEAPSEPSTPAYLGAEADAMPAAPDVPSPSLNVPSDTHTSSQGSEPMNFDQLDQPKEPDAPQGGEVVEDELQTFAAIGEDLERRSRKSATMVRLLEQHRQQLKTAEKERDEAYDKLARVVPVVQETALALREAMDGRKIDIDPGRMHKLFKMNGRALDELEKVSTTLFADFLWLKSAWEQYARSVEDARRFRANLDS